MEKSCVTCDNGNGVGGCGYHICCIQFSEWKPIPVKMEWQPIDTAPKDGIKIIAFDKTMDEYFVAFFVSTGLIKEWQCDGVRGTDIDFDIFPTHWMPLPQPPAGSP